jgi:hypothetical protein
MVAGLWHNHSAEAIASGNACITQNKHFYLNDGPARSNPDRCGRSKAQLHLPLRGEKAFAIRDENKSIYHRRNGLKLTRMEDIDTDSRFSSWPPTEAAIHLGARLRADESPSLADARAMDGRVKPAHDGIWMGGAPPPLFFANEWNFQGRGGRGYSISAKTTSGRFR